MICVVDCGTEWLKEIKENIDKLGRSYKVVELDKLEGLEFGSFSGIIISGASTNLSEVDLHKYLKPFKFIKSVNIPILGICLGHQIIGMIHGSRINKGRMIDKKEKIEILKGDDLFNGINDLSLFREEHCEFINLPKEFVLLAKSESCNNEAMRHQRKELYGVQFHPEVSQKNGEIVFKNFLKKCSKN